MLDQWVYNAQRLSTRRADMWCGGRKIVRAHALEFGDPRNEDLQLSDAGYTTNKLRALTKAYFVPDAVAAAVDLWAGRVKKGKYGSVSFHCYNHLVKDHAESSRIASKMGPCIQAVSLTLLDRKTVAIDAFYRTTELFKKFPADLVFLRGLLGEHFELPENVNLTCHFANITLHPMYWVTLAAHMTNPVQELKRVKELDEQFWRWIVKWTYRYLVDDTGIRKYAQAMRVQATIDLSDLRRRQLIEYLKANMDKDDDVLPDVHSGD